jgi:biopolymer transport protein ExbB
VFSIIQAAGWPIWPLLFASVIAVALIIERAAALRRLKIVPAGLLQATVAEFRQSGISDAQLTRLEAHSPLGKGPCRGHAQCAEFPRDHERGDRGSRTGSGP